MFVDFSDMPDNARVWIYQSDKYLSEQESEKILEQAESFLTKWSAHGSGLKSSAKIFHNRFVVLFLDEDHTQASGCSIDSSVNFIKSIGAQLGINFFDRTKVAFLIDNEIYIESMSNLKERVSEGVIEGNTLVFNNLVGNKKELLQKWSVPASDTWLSRYFN